MPRTSSRSIAVRIALVYALTSTVWILVSGYLAFRLPPPLEGIVETAKGLAFVAVTSVLLYLVIGRWTEAAAAEARSAAEARRRLQQVVDSVPVGVLLLDSRTTVTFMNPTAERLTGISAHDFVGSPLDALCGDAVNQDFVASVGELLRTGSIDGLELAGAERESGPRAVIARAVEIDPRMPGSGWIVALADYTAAREERLRSARLIEAYRFLTEMAVLMDRVREPRQLFEQLCQAAVEVGAFKAAWAMVLDVRSGEFVEAGSIGLGPAARAISERRLGLSGHPSTLGQRLAELSVIIENNLAADGRPEHAQFAKESKFGSYAALGLHENGQLRAAVVLFAEPAGFFGVEERRLVETLRNELSVALDRMRLDTLRLEAEEALARSESNYRQLFDLNPLPMWVRDWDTNRFLAVNDAALRKYGFSREQFLEMTVADVRPQSEAADIIAHLKTRTYGTTDGGIWTHRDARGRDFPVNVTTNPITWGGHPAELVMIEEVAQFRP